MRAVRDTNQACQLELTAATPRSAAADQEQGGHSRHSARDRVTVDLRALGPRLRAYAAIQGKRPSTLMRKAVSQMLDAAPAPDCGVRQEPDGAGEVAKVTLRMSGAHARSLAERARAAEVAQGDYVCGLLDGMAPAPPAADHAVSVAALRASTDRLAVVSSDLATFMRLLGRVQAAELESYRAGMVSLTTDLREHLACAAALVADLRSARSARR